MKLSTAVVAGLLGSALVFSPLSGNPAGAQDSATRLQIAQAGPDDPAARLQAAIVALRKAQNALRAAKKSGEGVAAAQRRVNAARQDVRAARQAALAAEQPADTPAESGTAAQQPPLPESGTAERRRQERRVIPPPPPAAVATEQPPAPAPKAAAAPPGPAATDDPEARLKAARLAFQEAQKAYASARASATGVRAARRQLQQAREALIAAQQAVAALARQAPPTRPSAPPAESSRSATVGAPEVTTGIAGQTIDPQVLKLRRKLRRERQQALAAEESPAAAQAEAAGGEVVRSEDDRVIVKLGDQIIIRSQDESERFLRDARDVDVVRLSGGRTRTTVTRRNGDQIITITNRYGDIIRRVRRLPTGQEIVLIDNRRDERPIINLDIRLPRLVVPIPREEYIVDLQDASRADIYDALTSPPVERVERIYSLEEVRRSERLRDKLRRIDLDTITFDSGSAAISPSQIYTLTRIGETMEDILFDDPDELFLVEGHTDAVGSALYNLALSDRRAESVAIVLSENFLVPPENLITQGYGEDFLKIPTLGPERQNRRVTIRRITPLIRTDVR